MKKTIPFLLLIIVVILALLYPSFETIKIKGNKIDSGDTAWMLVGTALVLIMTPGVAFFYGGMVSKRNMLSTMMQSFGIPLFAECIFGPKISSRYLFT